MKSLFSRLLLVIQICLLSACATQSDTQVHSEDLDFIEKIQRGGYVIFFRHAATDHSQKDTDITNLDNCAAQRRLNGLGKTQSKVIGRSFNKLKIPVGEIITSQYCRCINTAVLAFGRANPIVDITGFVGVTKMEKRRRIDALKALLAEVPPRGKNTVIVGHKWMFKEAAGILLEEGEAAIFKPDGQGATIMMTKVKANGWQQVSSNFSRL